MAGTNPEEGSQPRRSRLLIAPLFSLRNFSRCVCSISWRRRSLFSGATAPARSRPRSFWAWRCRRSRSCSSRSALAATIIRAIAGNAWVERQRERIDGLSIVLLFVFAVAVMGGVTIGFVAQPLFVIGLVLLSFMLAFGLTAVTTLVFARAGRGRAFALGLACGHRNLGLMLAATGGAVPDLVWLYFGIAQFPIYLVPQLLKPIAQRLQTDRERFG